MNITQQKWHYPVNITLSEAELLELKNALDDLVNEKDQIHAATLEFINEEGEMFDLTIEVKKSTYFKN